MTSSPILEIVSCDLRVPPPPLISPSRHHLRLDEEADPAGDDEHEAREVDLHQELHLLPLEPHLDATGRVGTSREKSVSVSHDEVSPDGRTTCLNFAGRASI